MGCGKTTLGKKIAARLGAGFVDIDKMIEAQYCKTVSDIFWESGQEFFRAAERRMLLEVSVFENVVIAAGGGTPCFFDNIDIMNSSGDTVYIRLAPEELATRLAAADKGKRPLLHGKTVAELTDFIRQNLTEREKFYLLAKYIVNGTDDEIVEKTAKLFSE
jgi:shikimate kinase